MNRLTIMRRLDTLQGVIGRNKPCKFTVSFADGGTEIADYEKVLAICRDPTMCENVETVTANRLDYAAVAGIMAVLCHPVPNRRIADYE